MKSGPKPRPIEERFWPKVDRSGGIDACWLWQTFKDKDGYGLFWCLGKNVRAHRVSWKLANGAIPETMQVLHRCDNPPCVNPEHLFIGTNIDNANDRLLKGRVRCGVGERHGMSKLTRDDVRTIRHLYFAERRTQQEIGDFLGVHIMTISDICRGQTWRTL